MISRSGHLSPEPNRSNSPWRWRRPALQKNSCLVKNQFEFCEEVVDISLFERAVGQQTLLEEKLAQVRVTNKEAVDVHRSRKQELKFVNL